jgi:GNAT superfamily N-acetyltransferase
MSEFITYDFMQPGDEQRVCNLVLRVFDRFVAPDYCEEGINEFKSYVTVEGLIKRSEEDHFFLLARHSDKIVGMIDIREHRHVSLFFVDAKFQNKGIGKTLFQKAVALCRNRGSDLNKFSVNSSPYAVPIYKKMGFKKTNDEQIKNGMRFFPMALKPEAS